jgi:rubrerythrin
MEFQAERFYIKAAEHTTDIGVRKLLGDLAEAEKSHENLTTKLTDQILTPNVLAEEERTRHRMFVLQYVQPGLAGLICDAGRPCRSERLPSSAGGWPTETPA